MKTVGMLVEAQMGQNPFAGIISTFVPVLGLLLMAPIKVAAQAMQQSDLWCSEREIRTLIAKQTQQQLQANLDRWDAIFSGDGSRATSEEKEERKMIFCSAAAAIENKQMNPGSRLIAMDRMRGIGTGAVVSIPRLNAVVKDTSERDDLRRAAVQSIRGIDASDSEDELFFVLNSEDPELSHLAADALLAHYSDQAGEKASDPYHVNVYMMMARNPKNSQYRIDGVDFLGEVAKPSPEVAAQLVASLEDSSFLVRSHAARQIGALAQTKTSTSILKALHRGVPMLRAATQDDNYTLRANALYALRWLQPNDDETIEFLLKALQEDEQIVVRSDAAIALGSVLSSSPFKDNARRAIDVLTESISAHPKSSASALAEIAESLPAKIQSGSINSAEAVSILEKFLHAIEKTDPLPPGSEQAVAQSKQTISAQIPVARRLGEEIFLRRLLSSPWTLLLTALLAGYSIVYLIRPLWLLKLDDFSSAMDKTAEGKNQLASTVTYLFKFVLNFLSPMTYSNRVLDAWVAQHLVAVREEFFAKDTVKERATYVPCPVILNDTTTLARLTSTELREEFAKHKQMLIWGEGGSGKTTLACQIAKWGLSDAEEERLSPHRMLPVLLEDDFGPQSNTNGCAFTAAILGQLSDEIGAASWNISESLFRHLLQSRRILVIVDHFSEMTEETRSLIRPDLPTCPVKALVITSRAKETLGHLTKITVQPLRIEGDRVASFIDAYLRQKGKRELFADEEFFSHCTQLSHIAGQGNITILLASLYVDQMISAKEKTARRIHSDVPDNIYELVLSYLNTLNRDISEDKLDNRSVHRVAKSVAWQCLKNGYEPGSALRDDVLQSLAASDAESKLDYLVERLHILHVLGPAQDRLRFALDPIAVYLAAGYLIDLYWANDTQWHSFYENKSELPSDFLKAVQDCSTALDPHHALPQTVMQALIERSHPDLARV